MNQINNSEFTSVNASAGPVTVQTPWPALPGWRFSVQKIDATPNTVTVLAGFREIILSLPHHRVDLENTDTGWNWQITPAGGNL